MLNMNMLERQGLRVSFVLTFQDELPLYIMLIYSLILRNQINSIYLIFTLILFLIKYFPLFKLKDKRVTKRHPKVREIPLYRYFLIIHMLFMSIMTACEATFMIFIATGNGESFLWKDFWLANSYDPSKPKNAANEQIFTIGMEFLIFCLFAKSLMTYKPKEYSLNECLFWNETLEKGVFVKIANEFMEQAIFGISLFNRTVNAYSLLVILCIRHILRIPFIRSKLNIGMITYSFMYVIATASYLIIVMLISDTKNTDSGESNRSIFGDKLVVNDAANGLFKVLSFSDMTNFFYLGMNIVYQMALACMRRVKLGNMIKLYPKEMVKAAKKLPANTEFGEERLAEMLDSNYLKYFMHFPGSTSLLYCQFLTLLQITSGNVFL